MLRITRSADFDRREVLKLEGKLMGPWVAELEQACRGQAEASDRLALDLAAVSFVDTAGVVLLRDLVARGARLAGCSTFVAEVLRRDSR
jgi:ABC-type transporter Mla MlaB component